MVGPDASSGVLGILVAVEPPHDEIAQLQRHCEVVPSTIPESYPQVIHVRLWAANPGMKL